MIRFYFPLKHLMMSCSSFQNVNIHRTPEDALRTVPPHLWAPGVSCLRISSLFPTCSGWSSSSSSITSHSAATVLVAVEGAKPDQPACWGVWKLHRIFLYILTMISSECLFETCWTLFVQSSSNLWWRWRNYSCMCSDLVKKHICTIIYSHFSLRWFSTMTSWS